MIQYFRRSEQIYYLVPYHPFPLLPLSHKVLRDPIDDGSAIHTQLKIAEFLHTNWLPAHLVHGLLFISQSCAYSRLPHARAGDLLHYLGCYVCAPIPLLHKLF